jgi:putative ABC transport system permease protein
MIMRIVKSDGVVIGTLYAQGYRRRELTWHYLAIPVLLAAVKASSGILTGSELADILLPINLLIAYDIIFIAVAFMVFDSVVEE